jgi:hypothetical protein
MSTSEMIRRVALVRTDVSQELIEPQGVNIPEDAIDQNSLMLGPIYSI